MRAALPLCLLAFFLAPVGVWGAPDKKTAKTPSHVTGPMVQQGGISYYSDKFVGRKTANGERYSHEAATCAHRTHPFGTHLRVTLSRTNRSVVCRVNDRGPHVRGRIVDLSRSLAREIGLLDRGVAQGKVQVVQP